MPKFKQLKHIILSKEDLLLLFLTLIGAAFRFYKLDWGPYYFHPDEHNIVYGISQLRFPETMHPDFFVYGSFPAYFFYFVGVAKEFVVSGTTDWIIDPQQSILIGRFFSALTSTAITPLIYLLTQKLLRNKHAAVIASALTVAMTGFIQYAHFITFESIQTFFYLLISLLSISIIQQSSWKRYIILGCLIGLTIGTKVNNLYLLILPLLLRAIEEIKNKSADESNFFSLMTVDFRKVLFNKVTVWSVFLAVATYFITNPYVLIDLPVFIDSIAFESNVATGVREIFYTREFIGTTPGLYQIQHVLPFISGYLFATFSIFSLFYFIFYLVQSRESKEVHWLPLLYIYGVYLFLNITLFVKWTRYMVPLLPLFIIASIWTWQRLKNRFRSSFIFYLLFFILLFEVTIRGVSFFTIYLQPDTRIQAAQWVQENVAKKASLLIEANEPNSIAFNASHKDTLIEFDFAELSSRDDAPEELNQKLDKADYFILSSRRNYFHALQHPDLYPKQFLFYKSLFDNELGFKEAARFENKPCILSQNTQSRLPNILTYIICPINSDNAEGTFAVFDHPTVRVYEKLEF